MTFFLILNSLRMLWRLLAVIVVIFIVVVAVRTSRGSRSTCYWEDRPFHDFSGVGMYLVWVLAFSSPMQY
jgi:hypothetical protein